MKKLLTAGALAGAIAFSPALAAPAHAGNNDDALLGVGLAVALGTAIVLANDYDDDHRHYDRSYNRGYTKGHVHTKDCNHGKHKGHVDKRDHRHDHDRDYRRGDRHDNYYRGNDRNHRYGHDRNYSRYDRFDRDDAKRIAKRHYNIDVQESFRRDNKIIVKGWDRRHRWTKIAFNARTGEVVNVTKKYRRG